MKPIGIGIISHAHGHSNVYCEVMQGFDDVELVANWDDNLERGQAAAATYGLDFRPDVGDVLSDPRIDAVIITCETNRHADYVELAAAAGKHILLQKPMATTLSDCDRIIRAVDQAGIKFSMAFQMRHDPVNRQMKELLDQGAVGQVAVVRRRHCISVLLDPNFVNGPTRWHMDPVANIGMFFDDAAHAADWFLWMLGQPLSVTAEVDGIISDAAPDDNGVALYRFAGGTIGILFNGSTTVAGVNTTEIYGDQGTIVQDYGDGPSCAAPRPDDAAPLRLIRRGDDAWTEYHLPIPATQRERIGAVPRPFIDYLLGRTEETITAREGKLSVRMVLDAYRSAQEGRRIPFD